jgi:oligopeptidase B
VKPPIADRIEFTRTVHVVRLSDPYHWLKDPDYPEVKNQRVLDYLSAENAYFEDCMAPHQDLVDELFAEIKARQPQEDESVPYRQDGFWYRWRFEKDAQYRIWERAGIDSPEGWEVILNEPALAEGRDYFSLGGFSVSPNGRYLAWSSDTDGSERYRVSITDLESSTAIDEPITNSLDAPVWSADSSQIFYLQLSENWRPYQVRRHKLGTPLSKDVVVYEEADDAFFVGIDETQSEAFIQISAGDHVTTSAVGA